MLIEVGVAVIAVAFAVLVGVLVPTLIQIRHTAVDTQRLVAHLDAEVPGLVREVRALTEDLGAMTDQTRHSVEHASRFLHAFGEVGESVHRVHKVMRGTSGSLIANVGSVLAGLRAASAVLKDRIHKEGGNSNGKQ